MNSAATLIPRVETPLTTTDARASLIRKEAPTSWREKLSLAALTVSIGCLAAAIFGGLAWWYTAGYALSSIGNFIAWKTSRSLAELNLLATSTIQLRKAHRQLQDSEERLSRALTRLQQERSLLIRNIGSMKDQNFRLTQFNEKQTALIQELEKSNQNLASDASRIDEQKKRLEEEVQSFQKGIGILRQQVTSLVERDARFAQELGIVHQDINQMQILDGRIAANAATTHQAAEELSRLIKTMETLNFTTRNALQHQIEKLNQAMKQLSEQLTAIQTQNEKEKGLGNSVNKLNQQIQIKTDELNQLRDEVGRLEARRSQRVQEVAALGALISSLDQASESLDRKLKKLETAKKQSKP